MRTTAAAVAVVGLALAIGSAVLLFSLHALLLREEKASASLRAADAVRMLESGGDPTAAVAGDDDVVVQVLDRSGTVLSATPNAAGGPALAHLADGESREVDVAFDDDEFLVVSAPASGDRTILIGLTLDGVSASTGTVALLLGLGLPALLAVVAATTWRVVGRALAPVEAIRSEVDAVSGTELRRRVPVPSTRDEIRRLAETMNRMLDRLERARLRERGFAADAAHELRSPIAALRQHAEVALAHPDRAGSLPQVARDESVRMQALVDDLLLLARAEENLLGVPAKPVDLDDLLLAEARRVRSSAESRGSTVDTRGLSAARVTGDEAALRRVIRNLGDNALRHAKGRVSLSLAERDGWAVLHVDDDGPGVPEADRARAFERFVRLDDARTRADGGTGLGLAIVAEVVAAHGGTAVIEDSPLGGTRVTVRLPVANGA